MLELYRSGLLRDVFVVGPIVLERRYPGQKRQKSHEVIQAGLSSVDGLVAIYWDSDVSFDVCPPRAFPPRAL